MKRWRLFYRESGMGRFRGNEFWTGIFDAENYEDARTKAEDFCREQAVQFNRLVEVIDPNEPDFPGMMVKDGK